MANEEPGGSEDDMGGTLENIQIAVVLFQNQRASECAAWRPESCAAKRIEEKHANQQSQKPPEMAC
jgi:hypothetical protein